METKILSSQEALPHIRAAMTAGHICRLVVTGASMLPFLRSRKDAVILAPCSHMPRCGDILFYVRPDERCILHRVQRVLDGGEMLLCGDAQTELERVGRSQIVAVVSHVERAGRMIRCDALLWRGLSRLWMGLRPIRPYLMGLIIRLWRLKERLLHNE